jgi:hypothetical protein
MDETRQCVYPQSFPTATTLVDALDDIIADPEAAASLYLDTKEEHSNPLFTEGEDHHQGLARTHRLQDGSIHFFLTHSEMDEDDQGQLMQFRYDGPTDGAHVVSTDPLTVAVMTDQLYLDERHPCDLCFLPDVEHQDAGYLFVAESHDRHRVSVWRWEPSASLTSLGEILQGFPSNSPNWVFVDLVDGTYYLGIAGDGVGRLFAADPGLLFPGCKPGVIDLSAFHPASPESVFIVPSFDGASQAKLVCDATGERFLLGFRSDSPDDPNGTDYVDAYRVRFTPTFAISPRVLSRHVSFPSGDTGFASTGTHYVDEAGRLLLLSSSRWSDDVAPGDASYVSRVDELASASDTPRRTDR